ncbi:MAG: hypothetical protein HYX74_06410 [Acidobacteria bacterium]|nr:hypothetical protein [Acidobacteriota bacterium]
MKYWLRLLVLLACILFVAAAASPSLERQTTGVLILAHGHEAEWNRQVEALAARLPFPAEVALGMAHKKTIEAGIERLEKRGVRAIVAVPLYVSSYSPIIRASAYLLGLAGPPPPELEMFNTMAHGLQDPHPAHAVEGHRLDLSPIRSTVPVFMTSALDDHPLVAQILLDRAGSISRDPERETVFLVAHGAVSEADDRLWQQKLARLAGVMRHRGGFSGVETLTVMDDAPATVRDRATARLRAQVQAASRSGTALVVPVLLSRGGIEEGLRKRLAGLDYRMPEQFLLPDPRIADWVRQQVEGAVRQAPAARKP